MFNTVARKYFQSRKISIKVVKTQEKFTDLDALDDKPSNSKEGKKGKKKGTVVAAEEKKAIEVEEQYDESTPWKGRPSEFFIM